MNLLSSIHELSSVLEKKNRLKLYLVTMIQCFSGILDLLGIAVIGILGALAVNGVQSRTPGDRTFQVLQTLKIENLQFQTQAAILGLIAAVLLILKSIISIYLTRKSLLFLAAQGASLSSKIFANLMRGSFLEIRQMPVQSMRYAITTGANSLMLGVIGSTVAAVSDFSLLLLIMIALIFVDPILAASTLLIFGSISLGLYLLLHKRVEELGKGEGLLDIQSSTLVTESLMTYRENLIRGTRESYVDRFAETRYQLSAKVGELSFIPNLGKYLIESAIILGGLAIAATQFVLRDATNAVGILGIFIAAGSRIGPAALRIQQNLLLLKRSRGAAAPTLALLSQLGFFRAKFETPQTSPIRLHTGFSGSVQIQNLEFSYPESKQEAFKVSSIQIVPGSVIAIVGASGAGKTTFADLILGLLQPTKGKVLISGLLPEQVIAQWPGAIAYVPQETMIINGTVKENICLGFDSAGVSDQIVWEVLKEAMLDEFVSQLPKQLNSDVGELGSKLSGGQRQRLGIARALLTAPGLIVLDEATSSLDGKTELDVTESILKLKGSVTLIFIAHRLSTVRDADQVIYLDKGEVKATGTFDEVRKAIPDFDSQASLMGL